ncbi:hypothetical protein [Paenibacillus sp. NRS-1760]|uniref:hypothetical protein n=1 Tax=Paenibacillus sp. NRS-1760 TaxID=3233902 RepID=UPI003D27DBAC
MPNAMQSTVVTQDDKPVVYQVEKDVSEVYRLRIGSYHCQWATITINNTGDLNVISDCGNFNYSWRMFDKENFKEFLIRVCHGGEARGYLYDKIHDRDRASRVDPEKNIAYLKKELLQQYREKRRSYSYMQEDKKKIYPLLINRVRDAWDELESIENEGEMSADAFWGLLWNARYLNEFFDGDYFAHCMDVETTGDRRAMVFCEIVAPLFAEVLKAELELKEAATI